MNIVSLLPSATEILFAIGAGDRVRGITHECDYPPAARKLPVLTRCVFDSKRMTQSEVDAEVRRLAIQENSLYSIDDELLRKLDPDLIVTQDLCSVCAVTPSEVDRATKQLTRDPRILALNPKILEDVFNDMATVAKIVGINASEVIERLLARVKRIAPAATLKKRPTVGCIEWLNPLWRTGHWVPGMVQLAGGLEVFADIGKPSRPLSWEELRQIDPEVVIIMPCGLDLPHTREEFFKVQDYYPWKELCAFQNQAIYLVDANAYFSRSGPRLVDGLEMLAEMLHPEYFENIAPLHSYIRLT